MEVAFTKTKSPALKRWKAFVVCWPILCVVFAGIVVCGPGRRGEERIADTVFTLLPLLFFAIGMRLRRRVLRERAFATAATMADVVANGAQVHPGNTHFFPEYEFQAGGQTFHVKSPSGYNTCRVRVGSQVKLYYAPENPGFFYVPAMQKSDNRWALLLCGVGVVFPLMGLLAPQMRMLVELLPGT